MEPHTRLTARGAGDVTKRTDASSACVTGSGLSLYLFFFVGFSALAICCGLTLWTPRRDSSKMILQLPIVAVNLSRRPGTNITSTQSLHINNLQGTTPPGILYVDALNVGYYSIWRFYLTVLVKRSAR